MIKKYKQIILLNLRNPVFLFLLGLFVMFSIVFKLFALHAWRYVPKWVYFALGNDFTTALVVTGLWFPFILGVHIKRQFANHRASLFPRYRSPHIFVGVLFYVLFISSGSLGILGIREILPQAPDFMFWGFYISFWLLSIIVVFLGYVSITSILFAAYVGGILVLANFQGFTDFLSSSLKTNVCVSAVNILLMVLLGLRLLKLKADNFEYPYLISWPQKDLIQNQLRAREMPAMLGARLRHMLHLKVRQVVIPKYKEKKTLISRALHWDFMEFSELKAVGILLLVTLPFYILWLRNFGVEHDFFNKVYSNFILFSVAPVLIAITSNYNKMSYWGYELLKPVTRVMFIRERAVSLIINLVLDWSVLCVFFAILPKYILERHVLLTKQFWSYILLTGCFSFLVLAWLSLMSRFTSARVVVAHGVVFSIIATLEFMHASTVPTVDVMLINSTVYFGCGIILARVAYRKWLEAEF